MKYFNLDLHISVIADIKNIINIINPSIEIVNWSLSGHTWVFNKRIDAIKYINEHTWKYLNLNIIKEFQHHYDSFLSQFDGFIVAHPNSFVLLYEKYNKPIIMVNSCRYDMPFCFNNNIEMINELHECIKRLSEKKLLTVISNNKADNDYFLMGNPNIPTQIIHSLCLYTNMKWNSSNVLDKFLLYSGELPKYPKYIINKTNIGKYEWNDLMIFKGIIHIPYEASTMSMFEQVSSEIPLFFPTKEFLKELWVNKNVRFDCNYWKKFGHMEPPDYLKETNSINYWIDRAYFYEIKGYYYFESFEHLYEMLENFKDSKYSKRVEYVRNRNILDNWKKLYIDSI